MHKLYKINTTSGLLLYTGLLLFMVYFLNSYSPKSTTGPIVVEEFEENEVKTKKARSEYFFKLLKDPEINRIPNNIRKKELEFAANVSSSTRFKGEGDFFEWNQVGPAGVGGRTRALAIDFRNTNIMIAGGVSGGIFKSTDGGNNWTLKSTPEQNLSVTSVAQDPTNPDTWYYAAGEFSGGSTTGIGGGAFLTGTGIFKSTDNGESWQRLPSTVDNTDSFNSPFDFVSRIRVNPQTGSVFISSNGFGILKSSDGETFSTTPVLGNAGGHLFSDIDISADGRLVASISERDAGQPQTFDPGIYTSTDDGETWTNITPTNFPETHQRTVIAIAPSNPNIVYTFTNVGGSGVNQDNRLFKLDIANGTSTNLSTNVPNSGEPVGFADTQGNFNMVIEVKPDDPDFVLIGTINLFKSAIGFSSELADSDMDNRTDDSESRLFWAGGYDPIAHGNGQIGIYPNQHPDQHIVTFDPDNPNRLWVGHDGGLSVTNDITEVAATSDERSIDWSLQNTGYNVTQFYTIAIPDESGDNRIMGGTQDNGTPFFNVTNDESFDISSGDGAFAFFTENFLFVSSQRGRVIRWQKEPELGAPLPSSFTLVDPSAASNQLFIHPYEVDPNDENIMYYPGGTELFRHTDMGEIPFDGSKWEEVTGAQQPTSVNITALEVSTNPANILYIGASPNQNNMAPRITKLVNADTANSGLQNVTPSQVDAGSFIHNIHVNQADANEVIAIASNFNVNSAFHTVDGGDNWTVIDGNLGGENGPSFRSAAIANVDGEKVYVVGTSIGVFSTQELDGSNTVWQLESEDLVGNLIVNYMDYRRSDDKLALGTHGRGAFTGDLKLITPLEEEQISEIPKSFELKQNFPNPFNPTTTIQFSLPTQSIVELTVYDIQGREVMTLIDNQARASGSHSLNFDASGLASGVYLYRITANPVNGASKFTQSKKLTLIK